MFSDALRQLNVFITEIIPMNDPRSTSGEFTTAKMSLKVLSRKERGK